MAAYVVGALQDIGDQSAFAAYQGAAGPTVVQYGGKLVVNSTKVEPGDGGWAPHGMVILEFESIEQAKKWYHSPEYQAVVAQRFDSADSALVIVDGD